MRETFVGAKESQGHRDQLSCLWWVVRRRDGILENALHPLDIDEIEAQGSLASGFHASMAVLVGQAHELLSLSELGPWKDAAEEQTHETADVVAEFLGLAHHTLRVAPGVGLEVWGVVCVVGRSSSGWFSRVGFDELAFVVDAYERFIASYRDLLSHVDRGNRVQGLEELHVVVVMNGRLDPLRRIESRPVHGPKASKLDLFEDDERAFWGGPVNTPARDFQTPTSSFPLDVSQVEPLLTAEKALSNVRHPSLDDRLALRLAYDCRVDDKASELCILLHGALKTRLVAVSLHHRRLHVVDDDPLRHTSEKLPRLFQSIDDNVQLLREVDVNVLVAAEAESDEQRPDESLPIRLRVVDLAELTKIHFGELTR